MRKLLYGLILCINSCTPAMADTITSGVGLLKPTTGLIDTTRSWADKINANFDIIASTLNTNSTQISNISAATGAFANGAAVAQSTRNIANSTGVWVNGVLVTSVNFTGSGQSTSFNGSTATVSITGGAGGSAISIGGYGGNAFKVAFTTLNADGDIQTQNSGSSLTFRVDLSTLSASTNTLKIRDDNLDSSTAAIVTLIKTTATAFTTYQTAVDASTSATLTLIKTTAAAVTVGFNNTATATGTLTTNINSTGAALTNLTAATAISTQTIANSTGVVVNGTVVSSFVFTGAGQSTSFNGGTVTVTISGGGGGGGGNFRLLLDGTDTGINVSSQNIVSGNGIDLKLYTSSFTMGFASTASIVVSTIQAFRVMLGTNTSPWIMHIATNNGYTGQLMAISTGGTNLFDLRASSLEVRIGTVVFYGLLNNFVTMGSTHAFAFPLTVGGASDNPAIWNNGAGFVPQIYVNKAGHAIISLRDTASGLQSEMMLQCDASAGQIGMFSNNAFSFFTNNTARGTVSAAGRLTWKTTDFVLLENGSGILTGTTTSKGQFTMAMPNGTTAPAFINLSTGGTTIYEFMPGSFTFQVTGGTMTLGSTSWVLPYGHCAAGQVWKDDGAGNMACANDNSGAGGSALSIGGYVKNAFVVAFTTLNADGDIQTQTSGSSLTFRVDLSTLSTSTNTLKIRADNLDTSTAAILSAAQSTGAALTSQMTGVASSTNSLANQISTNSVVFATMTWDWQVPAYSSVSLIVGVTTGGFTNGLPQFQNTQSSAVNVAQYNIYIPTGIALVGDPSIELVVLSTGGDGSTLDFVVSIATLGNGAILPVSTASLTNPILVQTWGIGTSTMSERVSNRVVATGWKTALQSAGGETVFQVARNGNSSQDASTQDCFPKHFVLILPRQNAKQFQ